MLTEKLFSGYAEGVISKERASALISKYEEEQRALFCKIKKAECAEESAELEAEIEKALREYTCADTENSDLLFSLVKKIEILSRDENPRSRKIRIF